MTTLSHRDPFSVSPEAKAGIRLLIVDDETDQRERLTTALRVEGYDVTAAASGAEAIALLRRSAFDIVITDLMLARRDVLRAAVAAKRDVVVIVTTAKPSVATMLDVMRLGAWDYLAKPYSATHLQMLLGRAAQLVIQAREIRELRAQFQGNVTLIGSAPAFRSALTLTTRAASTDAAVFFVGESGTGKGLFARFVHQQSRRANRPLVSVNCAAVSEPLLEAEMFGYLRGAFAGADTDKAGLLEAARRGTLVLDDVTEMPATIQAKLLRALQEGVALRLGSDRADAGLDVRLISTATRDPAQAVDSKLRPDLLYRLRVVPIRVPPLRERLQDVPLLANYFLTSFWHRNRPADAAAPRLTPEAIDSLRTRSWPGNVRELQNVIEHSALLAEPGQQIGPDELPARDDQDSSTFISAALTADTLSEAYHPAKEKLVAEFERVYLRRLVTRAGGNMTRAARLANIDRTTLYRLLVKHQLDDGRNGVLTTSDSEQTPCSHPPSDACPLSS